jgi:hypothetical protein
LDGSGRHSARAHTARGVRKTLGKALAEHGATTRELMDVLGHEDIKHAELCSRVLRGTETKEFLRRLPLDRMTICIAISSSPDLS